MKAKLTKKKLAKKSSKQSVVVRAEPMSDTHTMAAIFAPPAPVNPYTSNSNYVLVMSKHFDETLIFAGELQFPSSGTSIIMLNARALWRVQLECSDLFCLANYTGPSQDIDISSWRITGEVSVLHIHNVSVVVGARPEAQKIIQALPTNL